MGCGWEDASFIGKDLRWMSADVPAAGRRSGYIWACHRCCVYISKPNGLTLSQVVSDYQARGGGGDEQNPHKPTSDVFREGWCVKSCLDSVFEWNRLVLMYSSHHFAHRRHRSQHVGAGREEEGSVFIFIDCMCFRSLFLQLYGYLNWRLSVLSRGGTPHRPACSQSAVTLVEHDQMASPSIHLIFAILIWRQKKVTVPPKSSTLSAYWCVEFSFFSSVMVLVGTQ